MTDWHCHLAQASRIEHQRLRDLIFFLDKVVDVPVVQFMQERISEHTQTVNVPVPQIAVPVPFDKETDEVILPVTAERVSEHC